MSKLPAITLAFWIMKIAATTLGETAGDLLSMTLNIGYAVSTLILYAILAATLTGQLLSRRHLPFLYWSVIVSTSTAGTTMSDFMSRTLLGTPEDPKYAAASAILLTLLLATLAIWRLTEKSLSVTNITSRRGEVFYWTAITFSNTLGTSLGDFLSDDSGLGFAGSAALVGGAIALIAAAYYFTRISRIALFWFAFVLTRPFGAEMGDVLTKDRDDGGLGIGTIGSSAVLAAILIAVILYTTHRAKNQPAPAPSPS